MSHIGPLTSAPASTRTAPRLTIPAVRRLRLMEPSVPVLGLGGCDALDEVEQQMADLALGGGDLLGRIAVEHLRTGGKRLRARLTLATLEALGKPRALGVPWATACELLHNATLVHDDLQDGDRTRRGRPTVWARHGAAQAVNAGDLMLMLPFLALDRLPVGGDLRWRLARVLAECASVVARGQAAEIGLGGDPAVEWSTYREIIAAKTGALFRLPVEGAALLADRPLEVARAIAHDFERLGVLFQLQDDVVDLYGEKGREAPGSDLREGKISALVIEHLRRVPGDREWLMAILGAARDETPEAEVQEAIRRFREGGALAGVLERMVEEAEAVVASPTLTAEPAAWELGLELVEEILKPIAHLFGREHGADEVGRHRSARIVCNGSHA